MKQLQHTDFNSFKMMMSLHKFLENDYLAIHYKNISDYVKIEKSRNIFNYIPFYKTRQYIVSLNIDENTHAKFIFYLSRSSKKFMIERFPLFVMMHYIRATKGDIGLFEEVKRQYQNSLINSDKKYHLIGAYGIILQFLHGERTEFERVAYEYLNVYELRDTSEKNVNKIFDVILTKTVNVN